jgi:hypothetical protein
MRHVLPSDGAIALSRPARLHMHGGSRAVDHVRVIGDRAGG